MAESEGFEPPDPFGSTVFKTAAFDRSASSPLNSMLFVANAFVLAGPQRVNRNNKLVRLQRWRIINISIR